MAFKGQKRVTKLEVCQAELLELPVRMSGCTNGGVYRDITIWIKPKSSIRPCRNQFNPIWFDDLANHFYIPTRHAKRTKRAIKTAANFSNSQIESKNFQSGKLNKVLSFLEACIEVISGSSLFIKIQIMGGKITENLQTQ